MAESNDLLGAEDGEAVLVDFFEMTGALLFEKPRLDDGRSKLPTWIDCIDSASSSPEETTEPLLWQLNGSLSWL